jgi:hypothetical protein
MDADAVVRKGYGIYTPILFSQERLLLDHRRVLSKEIDSVGGRVGQDQIQIDPFPQLALGSRYLVILMPGTDPIAHGYTQQWLIIYDAFPIDSQGNVLLQPQVIEQGNIVQRESRVALADVASQLTTCPVLP